MEEKKEEEIEEMERMQEKGVVEDVQRFHQKEVRTCKCEKEEKRMEYGENGKMVCSPFVDRESSGGVNAASAKCSERRKEYGSVSM